jgi:hypothetical protein
MASRQFSTKSMYLDLLDNPVGMLKKYIRKIKVPLKITIFVVFSYKGHSNKRQSQNKKLAGVF